jgi:hypothetical protein
VLACLAYAREVVKGERIRPFRSCHP